MPLLSQPAAWRGSRTPTKSPSLARQSIHFYARHTDSASSRLAHGQRVWKVGFGKDVGTWTSCLCGSPSTPEVFSLLFFTALLLIIYFRYGTCLPLCLNGYQYSCTAHALCCIILSASIPPPPRGVVEMPFPASSSGC